MSTSVVNESVVETATLGWLEALVLGIVQGLTAGAVKG